MNIEYKPHSLEWTDEKVSRFWNFYNNYKPYDGTWFTEIAGKALLKFLNKHIKIKDKVLDYGSGRGFLLQHLVDKYSDLDLYACDFTESLAHETDIKFRHNKVFKGYKHITELPANYEDNFFDVVLLIETIEHLTDTYLDETLKEINRILKPGGVIIISTPNEEIIEKNYVHCADCGATFHLMQHLRSWSVQKLELITEQFNFAKLFCEPINLLWYQKNGFYYHSIYKLKKIFGKKHTPNLIYIGKKKNNELHIE